MLTLNCNSNATLIETFQYRHDHHRIAAYSRIMTCLCEMGNMVDLQVLDNKARKEYLQVITKIQKATFKLMPPDVHRRNSAECAIQNFKACFLVILAGIDGALTSYLWEMLLYQTKLTINLLFQATLAPDMSAWEY